MNIMAVLLTLLVLAVLVFSLFKKFYAPTTLLLISFLVLFVYSIVTKSSIMGDSTGGSWFIDIFEYMKSAFVSQYVGLGMTLLPLVGYSTYMGKIKASTMLTSLCAAPMKKIKNPYVVVAFTVIIASLLEIAVISQTATTTLLMATIFPILLSLGVSRAGACAAIILGGAMDLGPAAVDPMYALAQVGSTMTQPEYFVQIQIPTFVLPVIVAAVVSGIINSRMDRNEGHIASANMQEIPPTEEIGVPKFYALFPLFPIVLILLFSKLVISSIAISAFAAAFISFFVCMIIDGVRKKSLADGIEATKAVFDGMGSSYAVIISLCAAATVFAGSIQKIGGFTVLASLFENSTMPSWILFAIIGIMCMIVVVCTGTSQAGFSIFAPAITQFASVFGIKPEVAMFPVQITMGLARSSSPIGVALLTGAGIAEVEPVKVIKRNIVPVAVAWVLSVIMSAIIL